MNIRTLTYNKQELRAIEHQGQLWFDAAQAGKGLGFKDDRAVNRVLDLYENFMGEFTAADVGFVISEHVFSPSGIWLLAFAANTNKARAFAQWAKTLRP